jgi:hypothetical protein
LPYLSIHLRYAHWSFFWSLFGGRGIRFLGYSQVSGNDGFIIMGLEVGMGEEEKVIQIEQAKTTAYLFYPF